MAYTAVLRLRSQARCLDGVTARGTASRRTAGQSFDGCVPFLKRAGGDESHDRQSFRHLESWQSTFAQRLAFSCDFLFPLPPAPSIYAAILQPAVAKSRSFRKMLEFLTIVAENGDKTKKVVYECKLRLAERL
jgi:hypothetical protein